LANEHPIIILSAISDVADRILGLEMGASDYIAKPFDRRELLARIRSVARRSGGPPRQINKRVLLSEGWTIDLEDRALTDPSGAPVMLSAKEFDLLQTFVERPGRLLSRDYLLSVTHGRDSDVFDRVIDVTISRLRRKLERTARPLIIETVRGEGYRFRPDVRPV
jgi:DNA-binding response OmpR family regulator